jgi:HK97 family phage portal protein
MALFARKRKEKALTSSGDIAAAIESGWSALPLLGTGARQRIQTAWNVAQGATYPQLYQSSPALRQVLDGIVRDVGALELRLFEEVSADERRPMPDHPAALSLRYPSETEPADAFIRGLVLDKLIYDNAYALLVAAADRQLNLYRIPAYMVELQGSTVFRVENYRVWPSGAWATIGAFGGGAGQPVDFTPEQILHWHGSNPFDPRRGLSHIDTLRGVIAEDAALQQASVELAQAGLQEPSWIFRPLDAPQWSNAARAGFEEDLTSRMRRRTTKPVVLEEGMEVKSFGVTPRDAEMMAVREWAVAQIAAEYGVPRGKAGLVEASQEDEDAYLADVIVPLCKDFAAMLDQRICVRVYDDTELCFSFNIDERVQGNARLQALVSASGRAVMTTDEARAKLNLPPIDGGDELVTPLNVIVGEKPSPAVMPVQDPNKPPQDGSYRSDQGQTPIPSENAGKALYAAQDASQPPANEFEPLPQFHPRRAADLERQHRHVDAMQAAVQRHYNRLERSLREKTLRKAPEPTDWSRWDREFATDLRRALRSIVQAEGDVYALKLGAPRAFDMAYVRHYLAAMAEGAAEAINATIRSEIETVGLDDAMGRAPQHVASSGASLGVASTTFARDEAAKQAPDYEGRVKTWVADTGRHAEFDGDTVAIGEDWPAGFAPGSAPGCKCTMMIS